MTRRRSCSCSATRTTRSVSVPGRRPSEEVAAFCRRYDLIVCSDEIHCDLILDAGRYVPLARLGDGIAGRSITLMARRKPSTFPARLRLCGDSRPRAAAAISPGPWPASKPHVERPGWLPARQRCATAVPGDAALLAVLRRNRDRVEAAVAALPPLAMGHVEATYLAWIDMWPRAGPTRRRISRRTGWAVRRCRFRCPWLAAPQLRLPLPTLERALQRLAVWWSPTNRGVIYNVLSKCLAA